MTEKVVENYQAVVYLKFSIRQVDLSKYGFVETPASGILHDELYEMLEGDEGLVRVESVVVKECSALPKLELEPVQAICVRCNVLRPIKETPIGYVCASCEDFKVVPFKRKEPK